jgi:hypothetical protein
VLDPELLQPRLRFPWPVVTGRVLDCTGAFDVTLSVCSGVTFLGALFCLVVVKDLIRDAD